MLSLAGSGDSWTVVVAGSDGSQTQSVVSAALDRVTSGPFPKQVDAATQTTTSALTSALRVDAPTAAADAERAASGGTLRSLVLGGTGSAPVWTATVDSVGSSRTVTVDGRTGAELRSFFAFEGFAGGVTVAGGEVGRGWDEIVVGAGAGAPGGHVKVFDGATGALLRSFFAFDAGFAGGVNVAAGDLSRDGVLDVIAGADGSAPHVAAFDGASGDLTASFFAFPGFGQSDHGLQRILGFLGQHGFSICLIGQEAIRAAASSPCCPGQVRLAGELKPGCGSAERAWPRPGFSTEAAHRIGSPC